MIEVTVLAEGQTEKMFLRDVIKPHLVDCGVSLEIILATKGGGGITFKVLRKQIEKYLSKRTYITTAIDLYGIDSKWPGYSEVKKLSNTGAEIDSLKIGRRMKDSTREAIKIEGNKRNRSWDLSYFIPYFQIHEFEAILFSDIEVLAEYIQLKPTKKITKNIKRLKPEQINDNKTNAPSKRIERFCKTSKFSYDKKVDGIEIAKKIGLEKIREKCPNFNRWVTKLEGLSNRPN